MLLSSGEAPGTGLRRRGRLGFPLVPGGVCLLAVQRSRVSLGRLGVPPGFGIAVVGFAVVLLVVMVVVMVPGHVFPDLVIVVSKLMRPLWPWLLRRLFMAH